MPLPDGTFREAAFFDGRTASEDAVFFTFRTNRRRENQAIFPGAALRAQGTDRGSDGRKTAEDSGLGMEMRAHSWYYNI